MKVLIVEDSVRMQKMIQRILNKRVAEFFTCNDGSGALNAYSRHQPDWVLMDIKMKDVDGIKATRQIKNSFPDAKVIMVTNYDDPYLMDQARKAGACGYILKDNLMSIKEILTN